MISRALFITKKSKRTMKVTIPPGTYKSGVRYTQHVRMSGLRKNDVVLFKDAEKQHTKLFYNGLNISIGKVSHCCFEVSFRIVPGSLIGHKDATSFEIEVIALV
ncbi:MAG: hypothetical protein S4CHLAM20_04580 [Chlamydiia bacterium]|nr:hypothetical protein [Chlamydiia bacterium]